MAHHGRDRQLRHPHVNLFMGVCYDDQGRLLIIAERLKEDMEAVLRRIRTNLYQHHPELVGQVVIPTEPPLSARMTWARDVVKGLNWLHRNPSPVIHRDIKPANMLVPSFARHRRLRSYDASWLMHTVVPARECSLITMAA